MALIIQESFMDENSPRREIAGRPRRRMFIFGLLAAASIVASFFPLRSVQSAEAPPSGEPPTPAAWKLADPVVPVSTNQVGATVYPKVCAACHELAAGHAPAVYILKIMTPESIYGALTTGAMRIQAKDLSDEEKRSVAEFLTGVAVSHTPKLRPPHCQGAAAKFDPNQPPAFPAWGLAPTNTRYVDSATAGFLAPSYDAAGRFHCPRVFDTTLRVLLEAAGQLGAYQIKVVGDLVGGQWPVSRLSDESFLLVISDRRNRRTSAA